MRPDVWGATHQGLVREGNEDQFLVAVLRKAMRIEQCSFSSPATKLAADEGHLWLVADGMGGHAGGEIASKLATEAIEDFALHVLKWFFHLRGAEGSELLLEFEQALRRADRHLTKESAQHPELAGMGTTVTVVFFMDATAFVLHVGDSRCYLLKQGQLRQITHDHTLDEALRREGRLPADPASRERLSHILTNVVGGNSDGITVDIHRLRLEPGDQILLCTDGLNTMLSDREIETSLNSGSSAEEAGAALIQRALDAGGLDNVTTIVARFTA